MSTLPVIISPSILKAFRSASRRAPTCSSWIARIGAKAHGKTIAEVEKAGWNVGVAWQDGRMFHGPCAIRMNLALPLTRVQEAFERLDKYVFNEEWV